MEKKARLEDLISVIIPIYNAQEYLFECVESVRNQSHQNLQIILINDGSIDASAEICNLFAEKDSRIVVYHQENGGPTKARKKGLEIAIAQYVGFVDADDYIDKELFEKLLLILKSGEYDFVHSGYIKMPSGDRMQTGHRFDEVDFGEETINKIDDLILTGKESISPSLFTKLYRREFITKCFNQVPDQLFYGEDLVALCVCGLEGGRLGILNEALYYYRVREKSLSHDDVELLLCKENELMYCLIKLFEQYGVINQYIKMLMKYAIRHFMPMFSYELGQFCVPLFDVEPLIYKNSSKVVIYGAGSVGRSVYAKMCLHSNCEIVLWVDKKWEQYQYPYMDVSPIERLGEVSFDYVVIAIYDDRVRREVYCDLVKMGVEEQKICQMKPREIY